jgi:hypothetical protein
MATLLLPEYGFGKHWSCGDSDKLLFHHDQSSKPNKTREHEEDYKKLPNSWSSMLA